MTTVDIALRAIKKLEKYEKKEAQKLLDLLYDSFEKERVKITWDNNFNRLTF